MTTIVAYKDMLFTDTHLTSLSTEEKPKDITHLYSDQKLYPKMVELFKRHDWLDDNQQVKMKYGHKGFVVRGDNVVIKGDKIKKVAVADNLIFLPALEMIMLPDSGFTDETKILGFLNDFSNEVLEVTKRVMKEGIMASFDDSFLPFITNSHFIFIGEKENYVISPGDFKALGDYAIHCYPNSKEKVFACGSGWVALECEDAGEFVEMSNDGGFIVDLESKDEKSLKEYIKLAAEADPYTNTDIREVK